MNKVMFYNTLRKNKRIKALQIPKNIEDGETLKKELQKYFDIAKEVTRDYETIFSFDFLERIPIPNEITSSLISFINGLSKVIKSLGIDICEHTEVTKILTQYPQGTSVAKKKEMIVQNNSTKSIKSSFKFFATLRLCVR